MQRVAILRLRNIDDLIDIEMGGRALAHERNAICHTITVGELLVPDGEKTDGIESHLPGSPCNSDDDLAAVCDQ